ncbi:MAG: phage tail protein [Clostridiales Family XIII bacterium]|jgi:phage tail-like protein|nr:phage tail protein [Clostridiales Family XIII bacterium]
MAYEIKKYRISGAKLRRAFRDAFDLTDEGVLVSAGHGRIAAVFFAALDGVEEGCPWGRFVFEATVGADTVFNVKAIASDDAQIIYNGEAVDMDKVLSDPDISSVEKLKLFENAPAMRSSVYSNMLLHGLNGRYLWICLTAQGSEASFCDFRAFTPGDRFLRTFPEVYREYGGFFHRYLSVFVSLYGDLEEEITHAHNLLNLDVCPAELLPVYASWFGISFDGDYMDELQLRAFLKNAYSLIRKKGTKEALKQLVGIFVKEPFYIIEHADVASGAEQGNGRVLEYLYGDDPYSFTLMLMRKPDERLQLRLSRLINQFKPLRMSARILFVEEQSTLDSGANLDVNASIVNPEAGVLNEGAALDGTDYLN